jgi:hypothetical protein
MADIAAIFHWPPRELERMTAGELGRWQKMAVDRFAAMQAKSE